MSIHTYSKHGHSCILQDLGFVFNQVTGFPTRDQNNYLQELESELENERAQYEELRELAAGFPNWQARSWLRFSPHENSEHELGRKENTDAREMIHSVLWKSGLASLSISDLKLNELLSEEPQKKTKMGWTQPNWLIHACGLNIRSLIPSECYTKAMVAEDCLPLLHSLSVWLAETWHELQMPGQTPLSSCCLWLKSPELPPVFLRWSHNPSVQCSSWEWEMGEYGWIKGRKMLLLQQECIVNGNDQQWRWHLDGYTRLVGSQNPLYNGQGKPRALKQYLKLESRLFLVAALSITLPTQEEFSMARCLHTLVTLLGVELLLCSCTGSTK